MRRHAALKFKSKQEEADFWMSHDTSKFWDVLEDVRDPLEVSSNLKSEIRSRHEKTKMISLRLYPSQIRMAKAVAARRGIPYQALLRNFISRELSHWRGLGK